ncbi:MAG: flagellar biosynthetic protein FliR [Polyangiales bacterium]
MSPWIAWSVATLRVLPALMLIPVAGVGRWSWPLRVVVALVLAAGALAAPSPVAAPWPLLVARELTAGVGLALVLALPFMALDHAASLIAAGGEHGEALGTLARWTGAAAFLAARGHHGALRVLASSWDVLPPGAPARSGVWVEVVARATGDALAGALVIASSGVVALAALELSLALVARLSSSAGSVASQVRGVAVMAAVAVAIRVSVEVALTLSARAFELARAVGA